MRLPLTFRRFEIQSYMLKFSALVARCLATLVGTASPFSPGPVNAADWKPDPGMNLPERRTELYMIGGDDSAHRTSAGNNFSFHMNHAE